MNKDFVTYELAVKLKEKGFNWICPYYYRTKCKDLFMVFPCEDWSDIKERVNAPNISQVLKWLREEKKIYIVIAVNPTLSTKDKIAYYYQIYFNSNGVTSDYYESEECYTQWEDCAIDSIKYVLDNLI